MTRAVTLAEIADTNTFIVDGTNNRVGIASTIPTVTLDVNGVVKATSFTGNATGLTGTPDITVRNITGVAATFTGVLTYEDVTNIDSIGIITARSHVSIADSILHTGDTDTSIRFPAADTFTVETAGSEALRVTSAGKVGINQGTPTALMHVKSGANDGTVISTFEGATNNKLDVKFNGTGPAINVTAGDPLVFEMAGSEKLRIASAGVEVSGKLTFAGDGVSNGIELGADADLLLYHDNTDAYLDNDKGDFYIRNSGSNSNQVYISGKGGENGIIVNGDGSVELYHDNTKKFETTSSGVTVAGGTLTSNGITQYALPTLGNGGQLGWDDGTKSLRLYANSSTDADAKIQFHFNESGTASMTFAQDGTISDSKGNLRTLPKNTQGGTYTLVAADAGKFIEAGNTVTVPASVFTAGQMVTILNQTSGDITITKGSGLTLYNAADGDNNSRTLSTRGMATVLYASGSTAHISGAGLS